MFIGAIATGCKKTIYGCTDIAADNYNASATTSAGNCEYSGSITFWTNSTAHGFINVSLRGVQKQITNSYLSEISCGAAGCATFEDVPDGTYAYYATASNGDTWSGNVTLNKKNCFTMLLH